MTMATTQRNLTECAPDVRAYHAALAPADRAICELLFRELCAALPDAAYKVWHRHPVWFLEGNPIVGYAKAKDDVGLLFWSGQSFDASGAPSGLRPDGKFKAAKVCYATVADVDVARLGRWLEQARAIQWDYQNLVKRKGKLERLR